MSKKTLLWLSLLILVLFMIICIKTKIADFVPNTDVNIIKTTKKKVKTHTLIAIKSKHTDLDFKIDKNSENLSIDGVLNSENDFINLSSKYQGLKARGLKFDRNAENSKIIALILNLNTIFDKLKNGYIEYRNKVLTVKGIVKSQEDKEMIDDILKSVKDLKVDANIVVEKPKVKIKHIGKLSITKQGKDVTVSGIFTSEKEIESLLKLLKSKNINVKKELCVVDSDLKEDRWKVPFVVVVDDFMEFTKGTIQFDKDSFSIIGETNVREISEDIKSRLNSVNENILISSDIRYISLKPTKEEIQEKVDSILKLKSVRFKTATGILLSESKTILDEVAQILLKNPNIKVKIAGHTDSDGDEQVNLVLSQYRADTVRKYLIKKGIQAKNLKAIGYGEGRPLVNNSTEKNKQINRRVEFIILGE